jgi:hypothetical protein
VKNGITDLRNHLFEVMEQLKDDEKPMDLARAKVVCEVAQTIINSAKVEVDFLNAIDSSESTEFFELDRIEKRRSLAQVRPAAEPPQRRLGA